MKKIFKSKKGVTFFTLDTLFAGMIILITIILVLSIYSSRPSAENAFHELNNYMSFLSSTTMRDVRDNYPVSVPLGLEEDLDLFVYQKFYKLHEEGEEEILKSLLEDLTSFIIPLHIGFEYAIDEEAIYVLNNNTRNFAKASLTNRLLTYYVDNESNVNWNVTRITVWT